MEEKAIYNLNGEKIKLEAGKLYCCSVEKNGVVCREVKRTQSKAV